MRPLSTSDRRLQAVLRVALSHYVTSGASAALGLLLISGTVHMVFGAFAAAAASVGAIVVIPPDQPAPRRGKFWHLLPAALIGTPLFFVVQLLHADPVRLAALLVPATFVAFLGAAWGKRGLPISVSIMFAMIFSMAVPARGGTAAVLSTSLYFALGAVSYLVYATLANAALNSRYRVLILADTLFSLGKLMRTQAQQFTSAAASDASAPAAGSDASAPAGGSDASAPAPAIGRLLRQQAALSDQLQSARDLLLESPATPRRQKLAAMLIEVLAMRDHLVASELDLDMLKAHTSQLPVLQALGKDIETLAAQIDALADALLLGRQPALFEADRFIPARLAESDILDGDAAAAERGVAPSPSVLARGLVDRVGHVHDEVHRLVALARGDTAPDVGVVRDAWQMFTSPTTWSWRPFLGLWRWDAPPLRHAIRAALAIASGQAISLALPWGTHDYWILLTIVVVLRGSLAQTLERRNNRVAGTVLGSMLAGALLYAHTPALVLLVIVTVAQGIAHAFAIRRYLVTAIAATVLALVQAHLLNAGVSPAFEVVERIADTLIGVAIAWAFSYVLPSWERHQIPALVSRTLAAQANHARETLVLEPSELGWRLAQREVYDSLSALVQATQRSLAEPRAVRPPLEALGRLLAHSYQLLAQLTSVKTLLLMRRDRLNAARIRAPLEDASQTISGTLSSEPGPVPGTDETGEMKPPAPPLELPDPAQSDLSPWLLRRLQLAVAIAKRVRVDAGQVTQQRGQ